MKQIHAYDGTRILGTRDTPAITMCGMVGKANTRNPANVTCGRCKKVLAKLAREDRI
jgi:hypothetical protein